QRSGQQATVVAAGDVRVVISKPLNEACRAARFLRRHPCGVMSLSFRVRDIERTFALLEERGATVLSNILTDERDGGVYRAFEIATPLGDLNYRFIERRDYPAFAPGFETVVHDSSRPNDLGIATIDHVTSNMRTMSPFIL